MPELHFIQRLDTKLYGYNMSFHSAVSITERYAVKGGEPVVRRVGYWNPHQRLRVAEPNIWRRRADLSGVTLVNSAIDYGVLSISVFDAEGRLIDVTGIFGDYLKELQLIMNFTVENR